MIIRICYRKYKLKLHSSNVEPLVGCFFAMSICLFGFNISLYRSWTITNFIAYASID
jgi:hypothetical protein